MTIEAANEKVLEVFQRSDVRLVGMALAKDVIPGMHATLVTHAGPPIEWETHVWSHERRGHRRSHLRGARHRYGKRSDAHQVRCYRFSPNHEHQAVGLPMAGVITSHMPVFIMENVTYDTTAYSNVCEGQGKCLRFGAYDEAVIARRTGCATCSNHPR